MERCVFGVLRELFPDAFRDYDDVLYMLVAGFEFHDVCLGQWWKESVALEAGGLVELVRFSISVFKCLAEKLSEVLS